MTFAIRFKHEGTKALRADFARNPVIKPLTVALKRNTNLHESTRTSTEHLIDLSIEFIRAGGVDRERLIETEELKREQLRLETQQRLGSMDSTVGGVFSGPVCSDRTAENILTAVSDVLWRMIR